MHLDNKETGMQCTQTGKKVCNTHKQQGNTQAELKQHMHNKKTKETDTQQTTMNRYIIHIQI